MLKATGFGGATLATLTHGAGWVAKQWGPACYGELATRLMARGVRSLINYGPGDEGLAREAVAGSGGRWGLASWGWRAGSGAGRLLFRRRQSEPDFDEGAYQDGAGGFDISEGSPGYEGWANGGSDLPISTPTAYRGMRNEE